MNTTLIALLAFSLCLSSIGQDKPKPLPKDIPSLKALAEKGDANAQNTLAVYYNFGIGGAIKDTKKAVKWFQKAAEQGLDAAQIKELHQDLLALEKELIAAILSSETGAQTVELNTAIGRVSRIDALQNQQIAKAGLKRQQIRLERTRSALRSIAADEYGDCRLCELPIGFGRLKARPEAFLCVDCATAKEN